MTHTQCYTAPRVPLSYPECQPRPVGLALGDLIIIRILSHFLNIVLSAKVKSKLIRRMKYEVEF